LAHDPAQDPAQDPALSLPVPTSVHLSRMLDRAEGPRVSIGWLIAELGERSFGLSLLVMAIVALLPGASTIVGLLIAWPAIQLILGHEADMGRSNDGGMIEQWVGPVSHRLLVEDVEGNPAGAAGRKRRQ